MESTGKTVLAALATALVGFGATYAVTNKLPESNPTGHGFETGNRVQLHPGTDLWMRGDRYGEVVEVTKTRVRVKLDKSGRKVWLQGRNVMHANPTKGERAFEKAKFKSLRQRWIDGEVKVNTWSERDRNMISILDENVGHDLVTWFDEDAVALIEDGFIKPVGGRNFEESVIAYATEIGVPAYYHEKKSGSKRRKNPSPYVLRLVKDNWFVESSYTLTNEPVLRVMRWRVTAMRDPYMRKQDGLELSYRGDGVYWGPSNIEIGIGGGNTEAEVIFEQDVPPPKTKNKVRWKDGAWQKLMKKGWV